METVLGSDLLLWISLVEMPVLSGLFWIIWRTRKESEEAVTYLQRALDARTSEIREAVSAFKLEVAKGYSSIADFKDLETRIVAHLLRIEAKLDKTALKTEALRAESGLDH